MKPPCMASSTGTAQLDHGTCVVPHLGVIGRAEHRELCGEVDAARLVNHRTLALEKFEAFLASTLMPEHASFREGAIDGTEHISIIHEDVDDGFARTRCRHLVELSGQRRLEGVGAHVHIARHTLTIHSIHRVRCDLERSDSVAPHTTQAGTRHLHIHIHVKVGVRRNAGKRLLEAFLRSFELIALDEYGRTHGEQRSVQRRSLFA